MNYSDMTDAQLEKQLTDNPAESDAAVKSLAILALRGSRDNLKATKQTVWATWGLFAFGALQVLWSMISPFLSK